MNGGFYLHGFALFQNGNLNVLRTGLHHFHQAADRQSHHLFVRRRDGIGVALLQKLLDRLGIPADRGCLLKRNTKRFFKKPWKSIRNQKATELAHYQR